MSEITEAADRLDVYPKTRINGQLAVTVPWSDLRPVAAAAREVERLKQDAYDAHGRLAMLAASIAWATDGTLLMGVRHVEEYVRRLRAEVESLTAQLQAAQAVIAEAKGTASYDGPTRPYRYDSQRLTDILSRAELPQ